MVSCYFRFIIIHVLVLANSNHQKQLLERSFACNWSAILGDIHPRSQCITGNSDPRLTHNRPWGTAFRQHSYFILLSSPGWGCFLWKPERARRLSKAMCEEGWTGAVCFPASDAVTSQPSQCSLSVIQSAQRRHTLLWCSYEWSALVQSSNCSEVWSVKINPGEDLLEGKGHTQQSVVCPDWRDGSMVGVCVSAITKRVLYSWRYTEFPLNFFLCKSRSNYTANGAQGKGLALRRERQTIGLPSSSNKQKLSNFKFYQKFGVRSIQGFTFMLKICILDTKSWSRTNIAEKEANYEAFLSYGNSIQ